MFKELSRYVLDDDFKLVIDFNKVDIVNYDDIVAFDEDNIIVKVGSKYIKIKGSNLLINKLYNNELVINGIIKTIDMGD